MHVIMDDLKTGGIAGVDSCVMLSETGLSRNEEAQHTGGMVAHVEPRVHRHQKIDKRFPSLFIGGRYISIQESMSDHIRSLSFDPSR